MESLTIAAKILSWVMVVLGLCFDLFSLYCIVRVLVSPCFTTSSMPFIGLIFYCVAEGLGFPKGHVLLFLCSIDILIALIYFLVRYSARIMRNRHSKKGKYV